MISIVIPVRNQKELAQCCLDSLKLYTKDYQLIISDDGSNKDTKEYLYKYAKDNCCNLQRSEIPLGWIKSINDALLLVDQKSEYVVFANSDIVFTPNWSEKMIAHFKRDEDLGIIGPVTNSGSPSEYGFQHKAHNRQGANFQYVDFVIFFHAMLKKEAISRIGKLDERFGFGGQDDTDYCIRAIQSGYKVGIARDTFIYHYGTASFSAEVFRGNAAESIMYSNTKQDTLKQKYGKKKILGG